MQGPIPLFRNGRHGSGVCGAGASGKSNCNGQGEGRHESLDCASDS